MMYQNASILSIGYKIDKKLNFYIIKNPILLKKEFTINLDKIKKILHPKRKSYALKHGAYNPN